MQMIYCGLHFTWIIRENLRDHTLQPHPTNRFPENVSTQWLLKLKLKVYGLDHVLVLVVVAVSLIEERVEA